MEEGEGQDRVPAVDGLPFLGEVTDRNDPDGQNDQNDENESDQNQPMELEEAPNSSASAAEDARLVPAQPAGFDGEDAGTAEAEESPDQSVSSAGVTGTTVRSSQEPDTDATVEESAPPPTADVASSDDVGQADVISGSVDALQTGISSSTADADNSLIAGGNPATSSSDVESSDLLPSTSSNLTDSVNSNNGLALVSSLASEALNDLTMPNMPESNEDADLPMENVDEHPDTSAPPIENTVSTQNSIILNQQVLSNRPIITNSIGSHTAVSSSNTGIGLLHQVSSTNAELLGGDESTVSSSMNSNGNASVNSVGTHDAADALATLASAALNRQHSTKINNQDSKTDLEEPWFTVGIIKGTSAVVKSYIADPNIDLSKLTLDNLPDLSGLPVVSLEPGTGYKFRIAAINSCGRGEFGEESAFKTCVPGYPGAPSSIKITKSSEGAHLSWEPPQVSSEGIFEYSVYLAVKPSVNAIVKDPALAKSQLTFVRVYCGKANTCIVSQPTLGNAHVDNSAKPAIIFRIAARNDKGYGPATQVRWLQENKATGVKRILDGRPSGAPPSKQQKPNMIH